MMPAALRMAMCAVLGAAPFGHGIVAVAEPPRPKYAASVSLLADDHRYLRAHDAADFWRLVPHYVSQPDDRSCSTACAAMLVNAARGSEKRFRKLRADDELATPTAVLAKVADARWKKSVAEGGEGVSLDEFAPLLAASLKAYGVAKADVAAVHVAEKSDAAKRTLHETLTANERTVDDFLIANVLQSELTGDPAGAVGHFVVIAAFDAERDRVLVLDPDRRWYEPYWVPLDALLSGMASQDKASGKSRGYLRVKLP